MSKIKFVLNVKGPKISVISRNADEITIYFFCLLV